MGLSKEVRREGGAEQKEKEAAHQQNIVHSYYCAIRSMGDSGYVAKSYKSGHFMKNLPPTLLSKGKQLIVRDKLKTFGPALCAK